MLLSVFDLVAFAVDCVVSRNVFQLLICDVVTCVLNWFELILNV